MLENNYNLCSLRKLCSYLRTVIHSEKIKEWLINAQIQRVINVLIINQLGYPLFKNYTNMLPSWKYAHQDSKIVILHGSEQSASTI